MQKYFQREWLSRMIDALLPLFATLAALAVGAVMLLILKVNPIEAYKAMWDGAFGSTNSIAETLVKATPLLLVGIGICISFRGDVINIGATEYVHAQLIEQRGNGTAIMMIYEDLDEVMALSDRIAVIFEGQIMDIVPRAEATPEKLGLLMAGVKEEPV